MTNQKELLKAAKKIVKSPTGIVDSYDFTFVWVSKEFCELTGYKKSELIGSQTFKIRLDKPQTAHISELDIINPKGKIRTIPIKTKNSKIIIKIKIYPLIFENTPYMVAELLEIKK